MGGRGPIGHDPREAGLSGTGEEPEAERMEQGTPDELDGDARRPVGGRQETVNDDGIDPRRIGGDLELVVTPARMHKKPRWCGPAGLCRSLSDQRFENWKRLRAPG
jgi:hypothetical protein